MSDIILTTGDLKAEYEIIDVLFVAQSIRSYWIDTGGREYMKFFDDLQAKLKDAAREKGCDAVVWVRYGTQMQHEKGAANVGDRSVAVLSAYGTGVKIKQK